MCSQTCVPPLRPIPLGTLYNPDIPLEATLLYVILRLLEENLFVSLACSVDWHLWVYLSHSSLLTLALQNCLLDKGGSEIIYISPAGSPSRSEDVTVMSFRYKPTELAHAFLFSLSTVFLSMNYPSNSPLSRSVLQVLFLPYWPFQLSICLWKSSLMGPSGGELWTQKLKSHLMRTQSLKVLPL